jgi:hypothetical protein
MHGLAPEGWKKSWPFGVFLFGFIFVALAVTALFTGTLYGRGGKSFAIKTRLAFGQHWLCNSSLGYF